MKNYLKSVTKWTTEHAPQIMVGAGLSAMLGGTVALVPVSFKACRKVMKKEEEKGEKLTKLETIDIVWKDYSIPVATIVVGTGLVIFGVVSEQKTVSEMALALAANEKLGSDKTKEKLGIEDDEEKRESKKSKDNCKHILPDEKYLFYDELTNQTFYSTKYDVLAGIEQFNEKLTTQEELSINDYCDCLDINQTYTGGELGWNISNGLISIAFGSELIEDKPAISIQHTGPDPMAKFKWSEM